MSAGSCACSPTSPWTSVDRLAALRGAEINEAKKLPGDRGDRPRATAATPPLAGVAETARRTFEAGEAADTLPTHAVDAQSLATGIPAFRLFAEAGLAASNGEARRLIRGGGARVNDAPLTDEARLVTSADLRDGAVKLTAGRKQHRLVRPA